MRYVTPPQLKAMLHDGSELALLDVREAGEFGESHLLFATPLPYSRLELDIAPLVPRTSAPVVLCDDGRTGVAETAAKRLGELGYSDVGVLQGGTAGWAEAGYALFAGVNVPSKTFGELVEHAYHTPRISAQELVEMKKAGDDVVILDGRPFAEYHKMNIPGGICCPNGELALRATAIVKNPATKIVVNCAGRTRSIIGAQTLINFGVKNPVYALENGTQGWYLADLQLEHGAQRKYPDAIDAQALPQLQESARRLMARHGVPTVTADDAQRWLDDAARTTYLLDVRAEEEFRAGTLHGAMHAPGGQLIQATDQWVGVRNARIVLADGENVRAPVVAGWLKQLGCDVHVLEGGVHARVRANPRSPPPLPALEPVGARAVEQALAAGRVSVFDLRASMTFRKAHIPGSRWSIRPRLAKDAKAAGAHAVVLIADDERIARAAAVDLAAAGIRDVRFLDGGIGAWGSAGYGTASSPDTPADGDCIDYLFFVHDRHAGNRDAMRRYLAWETGLLAQLDDDERRSFAVGAQA